MRDNAAGGETRAIGAAHVERVLALAGGRGRGTVAVPGPARVLREGDRLVHRAGRQPEDRAFLLPLAPGGVVTHPSGAWRLVLSSPRPRGPAETRPADAARALFDADALPADLAVRAPRPGDRVPLLAGPTRKVQDVLVDAKVPREARARVPLLIGGDQVLWVAGLVRGRAAALVPSTTRVVEAVLERNE